MEAGQITTQGNGVHKLSGHGRNETIRSVMRRVGVSVTMEDINNELAKLGQQPIVEATFLRNYHLEFSKVIAKTPVPDGNQPALQAAPASTAQHVPLSQDAFSAFVRLTIAVEAAGGIERARRYLDVMEQIRAMDQTK